MTTANIASVRERTRMLEKTVQSLYMQVEHINVVLNNYWFVPAFLKDEKITVYELNNLKGDAGKFYKIQEGEVFLCDDDLIYPTDYVATMLWKLDEYAGKAIVTNHGKIFKPKPIKNYYASYERLESYHCLEEVLDEKQVQVGGSGVMCFSTSYFKPDYDKVTIPNMADLWVAKWAKEQGCKIIVNPHPEDWIIDQDEKGELDTIWKQFYNSPELSAIATDFFNSF